MDIRVTFSWGSDQATVETIEDQKITDVTDSVQSIKFEWKPDGQPVLQIDMKDSWSNGFLFFDGFCGIMIVHAKDKDTSTD